MAEEKKKPVAKKKPGVGRRKYSTPSQSRAQLEGVTAAQERYRRAKRKKAVDENEATGTEAEGIIIDSREKK